MTLFALGCLLGWLVTGTADYFATRRAVRKALDVGLAEGQRQALRQVAGW